MTTCPVKGGRWISEATYRETYLVPDYDPETGEEIGEHEEVVYLLCLDAKCKALDCVLIHRGGVNVASIAARKVVKTALDANATSVVLAHNHPSGLALPSPEDRQTRWS